MNLVKGKLFVSPSNKKIQTAFRRVFGRMEDCIYLTVIEPNKRTVKPNSISMPLNESQAEELAAELARWAHARKMERLLNEV